MLAGAGVVLLSATAATGDYVLALVESQSGATSAMRAPGETLSLDVRVTGGPGDATDSVGFAVTFSRAGLVLTDYAWAAPEFATGGPEDFTSPSIDELPATLTAEGITFSANTVAFGVTFSGGTLVTIELVVPATFPDGSDTIAISPDLFLDAETFEPVPTAAGPPFVLAIGDGAPPADDGGDDTDPPVNDGGDTDPDSPDDDGGDADPEPPAPPSDDEPVDNTDPDNDGDGVDDAEDGFPNDPDEVTDTDADGTGDNADIDDDGDGVADEDDAFPLDGSESVDSDGDGIGDNAEAPPSTGHTAGRSRGGFCGAAMLAPFTALLLSLAAWRRRRVANP